MINWYGQLSRFLMSLRGREMYRKSGMKIQRKCRQGRWQSLCGLFKVKAIY